MLTRNMALWLAESPTLAHRAATIALKSGLVERFVAGESMEDGLRVSSELNHNGLAVNLNWLGEHVADSCQAETACNGYVEILNHLSKRKIDGSIAIKPTQLGLHMSRLLCQRLANRIAREAAIVNIFVEIDMEDSGCTQSTIDLFRAVRSHYDNVGLAIQSYLYRSEQDLSNLRPLHPKIRLIKGAYRESHRIAYRRKSQVDANFQKLMRILFAGGFTPAIATHDPRLVEEAIIVAQKQCVPKDKWEFQMLLGVQRELQLHLVRQGYRMRVYVPFGTHWFPYFMRRIAERPANLQFVLRSILKG